MKKTEGDITTTFSCTCPYCNEYKDTDHNESLREAISDRDEYWFSDF